MGCGCKGKKGRSKDMSRGEFLGVGAAAAATLGATGVVVGEEREEPRRSCDTKPAYCGTFHNDPPPDPTWTIDASVLQVLWGEIYPRMVAQAWTSDCPNPITDFVPGSDLTSEFAAHLKVFRDLLVLSLDAPPGDLSTRISAFNQTRFGARFNRVLSYYEDTPVSKRMPIRYWGPGAFDFILSDYGLDLFAPEMPTTADELLRYYEFRHAGRSTIGIPEYLDDADALAFDVQSPAGPSQVSLDAAGRLIPVNELGCKLEDLRCLDASAPLRSAIDRSARPLYESLNTRRHNWPAIIDAISSYHRAWPEDLDPAQFPDPGQFLDQFLQAKFPEFVPVVTYTIQSYYSAVSKLRCWQLEGSVYRGILEQLPRVVAAFWREQRPNCAASYADRFNHPVLMRQIFEERLETMLPGYDDMVFQTGPRPGQPALTDIEISNQGIRFPKPAAYAPTIGTMFESIAQGRAGNPVFTDTRRPPRGGDD